ncbi:hypothetical protein AQUCO_05800110v1 [Aquilegia coerulea]|uniref:HIT domain-containing protein n=1 Tax=Aquilegia coerulea TaxID=218851 RepID=A0A2G5CG71_AQUCA|nr:hypothetical protein AQUCO_05800110v1 [Aquilegia coerulea]
MESQRRLAVLCSHLRQVNLGIEDFSGVSTSSCFATKGDEKDLKDSGKESEEKNCIFCKIIRGESPCMKIYEDDVCLCILDLNPLTNGHSLVIPKCHFSSLRSTPPSVIASMFSKIPLVSSAIMKAANCDSFNLLVNNGAAAGQVIFHTHLHIIPRKACDRLWNSETFNRQRLKLDEETALLAGCIREKLSINANCEDVNGKL